MITPPFWSPVDENGKKVSVAWVQFFNQIASWMNSMIDLNLISTGGDPSRTKFQANGSAANVQNVLVDIWDGNASQYVFPASPIQMAIVSTSANDTAAGTGARTVGIEYLDNNYNSQELVMTLNGVTPVNTIPTNILRINDFHVHTVGSDGLAAGNISLTSVGGATTYAYIPAGENKANHPIFTVPAGKTAYITQGNFSSGSASGQHFTQIMLRATCDKDANLLPGAFQRLNLTGTLNGGGSVMMAPPLKIPATADIKVSAISDAGNANVTVTAFFEGWLQ